MMDHFVILKWAAGSEKPIPHNIDFEEDRLIELVDLHHLAGRFLQRIKNQTFPWVTPRLIDGLRELDSRTSIKVVEHANAIRQIDKQLSDNNSGSIVVKGISTYALVNQQYTKRYGGDIDLLYCDSAQLLDVLKELGYQQSKAPFLYEVGGFRKGDIEFDVHEYFPVFSYTAAMRNANLSPGSHPGIWCQSYQMEEYRITYNHLRDHSCYGNAYETRSLAVPDPNMLALILCAHAFRHYTDIWSISCRVKPVIPLAELRDLFDLAAHPKFSKTQFLSLVSQFGGEDAVEWAACLTSSFFGQNPLPISTSLKLDDELPEGRFPRCLWWNFWTNLVSPINGLLDSGIPPMNMLIEQLGANEIVPMKRFSTVDTDRMGRLPRSITQSSSGIPIPLELEVSESEQGVRFDLHILSVPPGDADRIRVDFGHAASEWLHLDNEHQQFLEGTPAITSFTSLGIGYRLSIEFTWEVLKYPVRDIQEIPLLLGIAKQAHGKGVTASTLIPINILLCS